MDSNEADHPSRRFSLGDGLILMAVLALTLSILRFTEWFAPIPGHVRFWRDTFPRLVGVSPPLLAWGPLARTVVSQVVAEFLQLLGSALPGLTLAQPFMRLRCPRPPLRDLVRQSGFVVCL